MPGSKQQSEEAQRVDVVADQEVLGLLVVVEHHFVGFAADTGLLVATEGGVRRVQVVVKLVFESLNLGTKTTMFYLVQMNATILQKRLNRI